MNCVQVCALKRLGVLASQLWTQATPMAWWVKWMVDFWSVFTTNHGLTCEVGCLTWCLCHWPNIMIRDPQPNIVYDKMVGLLVCPVNGMFGWWLPTLQSHHWYQWYMMVPMMMCQEHTQLAIFHTLMELQRLSKEATHTTCQETHSKVQNISIVHSPLPHTRASCSTATLPSNMIIWSICELPPLQGLLHKKNTAAKRTGSPKPLPHPKHLNQVQVLLNCFNLASTRKEITQIENWISSRGCTMNLAGCTWKQKALPCICQIVCTQE